jgi:hypothetical protein
MHVTICDCVTLLSAVMADDENCKKDESHRGA